MVYFLRKNLKWKGLDSCYFNFEIMKEYIIFCLQARQMLEVLIFGLIIVPTEFFFLLVCLVWFWFWIFDFSTKFQPSKNLLVPMDASNIDKSQRQYFKSQGSFFQTEEDRTNWAYNSPKHFLLCKGKSQKVAKRGAGRSCASLAWYKKSKKGFNFCFYFRSIHNFSPAFSS